MLTRRLGSLGPVGRRLARAFLTLTFVATRLAAMAIVLRIVEGTFLGRRLACAGEVLGRLGAELRLAALAVATTAATTTTATTAASLAVPAFCARTTVARGVGGWLTLRDHAGWRRGCIRGRGTGRRLLFALAFTLPFALCLAFGVALLVALAIRFAILVAIRFALPLARGRGSGVTRPGLAVAVAMTAAFAVTVLVPVPFTVSIAATVSAAFLVATAMRIAIA